MSLGLLLRSSYGALALLGALISSLSVAPLAAQSAPAAVSDSARAEIPAYVPQVLQPADLAPEIALLRRALEEVHAGWDRYVPRRYLDSAFARLDRRAQRPMTDLEYYHDVALLLARLRCDHTKAELPAAIARYRETQPTFLPMRLRIYGERIYVDTGAGLARGTEIRAINGIPATEVITKLSRYVAVDGFTDFARAARLESDGDLMGNDLDHYWPFEFGFASSWTFELADAEGRTSVVTRAPITFAAWSALGGTDERVDFRTGTSWRALDDSTALLTVRSFVNYRTPVSPDSVYGGIMRALASRGITHLIVDLRDNGGGSDDASWGLVRHLIDAPVDPVRSLRRRTINVAPELRAAFETWGDPSAFFEPNRLAFTRRADGWYEERLATRTLRPARDAFAGNISVLTSRHNSSGSTMLLAVLQQEGARNGRIRLVGEETGGSAEGPTAGQILFLRLPASGLRVRIPLKRTDMNVSFVAGMGVFPDIDAVETVEDLRAGRDRALNIARATGWTPLSSMLASTAGVMRGELVYRDYRSGRLVTLPTVQHVAPIGLDDAVRVRTIYDDGPGNTIYSTDVVVLRGDQVIEGAPGGRQDTLTIASRRETPEGTELVLLGTGMDDDKPVEFRYTWTIGRDRFVRLKEFRAPGATAWEYRHVYRFARGVPAASR